MPLEHKEGKDTIIFVTREDHSTPSKIELPEPEPSPGLILPNGEINWNCPCLGGMATGPCGLEFREAFSCFHYSNAEPKGSDCYNAFYTMQSCMSQYPSLYGNKTANMSEMGEDDELDSLENKNSGSKSEAISVSENRTDIKEADSNSKKDASSN